jgi:lipooligosaccharide transport system ATP-binding protein
MDPLFAENLGKRYGDRLAVRGLSFRIGRGECAGFLGPNGAGKTTTMRICLGLTRADSGFVRALGYQMPAQALAARARIGVVPQKDALDPDFTVAENLRVFAQYFGIAAHQAQARIPGLLEFAGLEKRAADRIFSLSGGMQRRLTLARALINDPDLIFLDEPTTGLDPQARHLIWERLRRLLNRGKTLLLNTHFMEEAERLCGRVYILDGGEVIAAGAPRELIARHIEPEVVEVSGDDAADWLHTNRPPQTRTERFGDLIYCYSAQSADLMRGLRAACDNGAQLRFVHRPANLEDVFLKLTGRDLRE